MKKVIRFLSIGILCIILLYVALFVFLNIKGKSLLVKTVSDRFDREPELGSFAFSFPFKVTLKNFSCGDVSFEIARIGLVGFNPFALNFIFDNLYVETLKVKVERKQNKLFIDPFLKGVDTFSLFYQDKKNSSTGLASIFIPPLEAAQDNQKISPPASKFSYTFKNIFLKNTSVKILDTTLQPPQELNLENLNIKLKDFIYPQMLNFYIDMDSSLLFNNTPMKEILNFKGWVDWHNKNMDATFKINNYDYIAFADFYPPFWKPDNLEIQDAKLSLDAHLKSHNNDLTINALIMLEKIIFKENPSDSSTIESLKEVIALFRQDDGRVIFRLPSFHTKMDKIELDFVSIWTEFQKVVKVTAVDTIIRVLEKPSQFIGKGAQGVKEKTIEPAVEALENMLEHIANVFLENEPNEEGSQKLFEF